MFNPWVGKIPWRRERLLTPVVWPGEFHGLYSPWGRKQLDMTEQLSLHFTYFLLSWQFAPQFPSSPLTPSFPCLWFTISGKEKSGGTFTASLGNFLLCLYKLVAQNCLPHKCRIQLITLCFLPASEDLPSSSFQQHVCFLLSSVNGHSGSVHHPLKCLGNEYTKYFWLKQKYLLFVTS